MDGALEGDSAGSWVGTCGDEDEDVCVCVYV